MCEAYNIAQQACISNSAYVIEQPNGSTLTVQRLRGDFYLIQSDRGEETVEAQDLIDALQYHLSAKADPYSTEGLDFH